MFHKDMQDRIEARQARITVVGLGYVGLPLAVEFAAAGVRVAGFEIDSAKLALLKQGESYIRDVPSSRVNTLITSEMLLPTSNPEYIGHSDVVVICVPTPCGHDNQPDLTYVESAGQMVASQLRPGQLVILESTSFPGTTEEVLQPILEQGGLKADRDFYLAFSPERIDPGNQQFSIRNTPKLVAGTRQESTDLAAAVYSLVAERVLPVSSPRVAEMAKLYENTFRHINIGFANEMALLCEYMGIDIWEVIDAASSKPFGFMPFYPGPGVGGHCIPVDPQYLLYKAREHGFDLRFVELANHINEHMPMHVVSKAQAALLERSIPLEDAEVMVLGVAYKKDIDDCRESPAIKVIENLVARGARVRYHDPHVPSFENGCGRFESVDLTDEELMRADCVLICTDHTGISYDRVAQRCPVVIDTRHVLRNGSAPAERCMAQEPAVDEPLELPGELVEPVA